MNCFILFYDADDVHPVVSLMPKQPKRRSYRLSMGALLVKRALCFVRMWYLPMLLCVAPCVTFWGSLKIESHTTSVVTVTNNRKVITQEPPVSAVSLSALYPHHKAAFQSKLQQDNLSVIFKVLLESEGSDVITIHKDTDAGNALRNYIWNDELLSTLSPQPSFILGGLFDGNR